MSAQAKADLTQAAEVIAIDGWTQGVNFHGPTGCRCAMGALAYAVSDGTTSSDGLVRSAGDYRRLEAATDLMRTVVGESISYWNDAPGRTKAEIIAALRAAADKADQS